MSEEETNKEFGRAFNEDFPGFSAGVGTKTFTLTEWNKIHKKVKNPMLRRKMGARASTVYLADNGYIQKVVDGFLNIFGWVPSDKDDVCDPPVPKFKPDGTEVVQRPSNTNNIWQIAVGKKNAMIATMRNNVIRRDRESYRLKYQEPKEANKDIAAAKGKELPRLLKMEPAVEATHGFNGWIGYHEGHPMVKLIVLDGIPNVEEREFHEWKKQEIVKHTKNPGDILALILEKYPAEFDAFLTNSKKYSAVILVCICLIVW